jgi:hypothetical protein
MFLIVALINFRSGTNVSYSGIGTIETLDTTTGTIDYLSGTNVSYSGIGTIETLDTTTPLQVLLIISQALMFLIVVLVLLQL